MVGRIRENSTKYLGGGARGLRQEEGIGVAEDSIDWLYWHTCGVDPLCLWSDAAE